MKEFSKLTIDAIHVGICFSEPVYFEDGVNMFLPAEKPATVTVPEEKGTSFDELEKRLNLIKP